jgi:hypothetical protein
MHWERHILDKLVVTASILSSSRVYRYLICQYRPKDCGDTSLNTEGYICNRHSLAEFYIEICYWLCSVVEVSCVEQLYIIDDVISVPPIDKSIVFCFIEVYNIFRLSEEIISNYDTLFSEFCSERKLLRNNLEDWFLNVFKMPRKKGSKKKQVCSLCGQAGHKKTKCPVFGCEGDGARVCSLCKKPGHDRRTCGVKVRSCD